MNIVSLFSGIGGFEAGIQNSNLNSKFIFSSEIDKFAQTSYELNFNVKPQGDITKIHEFLIPDHDILTAGFPCQSFSIAGKRRGFEDTRGTLFFDIARIINWKKPQFIILENVKNLISHDNGQTVLKILKVLSDMNYTLDIKILNSKDFGTAQNRERTYIIGVLDYPEEDYDLRYITAPNQRKLKAFLNENEFKTFNFNLDNKNFKNVVLEDILEDDDKVDDKYFFNKITTEDINTFESNKDITNKDGIIKLFDIPKVLHNDNERQRRVYSSKGLAPTVLARTDSAKVLVENGGDKRIRKLTPLECFRLQGFTDEFYFNLKNNGLSDNQLYKQAGNAVTTTVITAIADKLKEIAGVKE